jgi:hypothetical protein
MRDLLMIPRRGAFLALALVACGGNTTSSQAPDADVHNATPIEAAAPTPFDGAPLPTVYVPSCNLSACPTPPWFGVGACCLPDGGCGYDDLSVCKPFLPGDLRDAAASDAGSCSATSTGGIPITAVNYQSSVGKGGYAWSFHDSCAGYASTACLATGSLCGSGSDVPSGGNDSTCYGGGLGLNVDQALSSANVLATQAQASGLTYLISGDLLSSMRVQICTAPLSGNTCPDGKLYCANLTSTTATIAWSDFNTQCWSPSTGTALAANPLPSISQVSFLVPSASSISTAWDFCVDFLGF